MSEMSATKRKAPAVELQRRVRVRREDSEELDSTSSINGNDASEEDSNDSSSLGSEVDEVSILALKIEKIAKP